VISWAGWKRSHRGRSCYVPPGWAHGSPSLTGRWQRPALRVCRWGLAGVGLGSLALGVAFGFARNPEAALNASLQPGHLAVGLALALTLAGLIKLIAAERTQAP
jgi:hypothetical protein